MKPNRIRKPIANVRRSAGSARCSIHGSPEAAASAPSARARCGAARRATSAAPARLRSAKNRKLCSAPTRLATNAAVRRPIEIARDDAGHIGGKRVGRPHFAAFGEMRERQREGAGHEEALHHAQEREDGEVRGEGERRRRH